MSANAANIAKNTCQVEKRVGKINITHFSKTLAGLKIIDVT
jgi:hypothetical protein